MAKYGQSNVLVVFDRSDGSTTQDMTAYVQSINGIKVSAMLEPSDTFGDSWQESLASGVRKMDPIVIEGIYDDTATTGPDAIFNAPASSPSTTLRTLTLTYGGSKTTSVECLIADYERMLVRGKLHRYKVTLQPTSTVTEA